MRELPAVSDEMTKKQLIMRLGFYGFDKSRYAWRSKTYIIQAIQLVENLNTRRIEDTDHE